jgi:hypothetical protein
VQFIQDRPFAGGSRDARTSGSSVGGPDTLAGLAEVQRGARTLPDLMSVPGQKRKCPGPRGKSVSPSGADIVSLPQHARLVPMGDIDLANAIAAVNSLPIARDALAGMAASDAGNSSIAVTALSGISDLEGQ